MNNLLPISSPQPSTKTSVLPNEAENRARTSAQDFETAFIAQMLQYSGLADALTSSGGEDMQGFTQFYLESLAKKITENGGFGVADKIYNHIKNKEADNGELGRL